MKGCSPVGGGFYSLANGGYITQVRTCGHCPADANGSTAFPVLTVVDLSVRAAGTGLYSVA